MIDIIVAKEGHKKILVAFIALLVFLILGFECLAFLSFATFIFCIYAYRFKYIDTSSLEENSIYAPISGKITAIDNVESTKRIYIDVSLFDTHILRNLDNNQTNFSMVRGLNLSIDSLKAKKLNERAKIEYKDCSLEIFSSVCNESIKLEEECIKNSKKGEKIGTLLHGQVIVTLHEKYKVNEKIGASVVSGFTKLAIK